MIERPIQLSDRVVRAGQHLAEEIDGQVVLLSIEAGNYYGLDEIGSEIWRALEKETFVAELCDVLVAKYGAARTEVIHRDVLAFLSHLQEHGLITVAV